MTLDSRLHALPLRTAKSQLLPLAMIEFQISSAHINIVASHVDEQFGGRKIVPLLDTFLT